MTITHLIRPLLAAAAFTLFASQGQAANEDPVFYLSGAELDQVDAKKPTPADMKKINEGPLQFFCADQPPVLSDEGRSIDLSSLKRCESNRRIDTVAGRVTVMRVALTTGTCPTDISAPLEAGRELRVTFTEKKRRTLFGEGLRQIFDFLAKKAGITVAATAAPKLTWCLIPASHVLQLERSVLTVTAKYADAKNDEPGATAQIITGPAEHFFLSGDGIVRGASEVRWDAATQKLVARDKPDQLYLGINYMLGDVFSRYDGRSTERIVIKFLLQPSRKPFDSVGLAVGYRMADGLDLLGKNLDNGGAVVFVGYFSTRGDQLDANGSVVGGKREGSWRLGFSYSLDTLLAGLK